MILETVLLLRDIDMLGDNPPQHFYVPQKLEVKYLFPDQYGNDREYLLPERHSRILKSPSSPPRRFSYIPR